MKNVDVHADIYRQDKAETSVIYARFHRSTIINGREYSAHAIDRMQGRGIMPSAVENTINNGIEVSRLEGKIIKYDPVNHISVVINETSGKVITVSYGQFK